MKKIMILLCFLICLIPSCVSAANVDSSLKIYDYAELLNDSEENNLYNKVSDYIESTNFDMVIVTISENNKGSSAAYADDFYDYNNFGLDDEYSGILYLIDMDTREIFISTTGKAINVYNDSIINDMLDDIYTDVFNRDYYNSCITFVEVATDNYYTYGVKSVNWLASIIVALIVPSVVVAVMICSHKKIKLAITADNYVDKKATKVGVAKDRFLTKNVSRIHIAPSSSSGGGTSTRVGSSGRSHGGGGRKF